MAKSTKNRIRISRHFLLSEFECPCCRRVMVDFRLVNLLEALRRRIGDQPVIINSGYRCEAYNRKIGGDPNSYHLLGMAADIRVPEMEPARVLEYAREVGFMGLGLYGTFCHLDIRGSYASWKG